MTRRSDEFELITLVVHTTGGVDLTNARSGSTHFDGILRCGTSLLEGSLERQVCLERQRTTDRGDGVRPTNEAIALSRYSSERELGAIDCGVNALETIEVVATHLYCTLSDGIHG